MARRVGADPVLAIRDSEQGNVTKNYPFKGHSVH
jgi:hypothetical protein